MFNDCQRVLKGLVSWLTKKERQPPKNLSTLTIFSWPLRMQSMLTSQEKGHVTRKDMSEESEW